MVKDNYYVREQECNDLFCKLGSVYNANTPENHPVIFTSDDDFKAVMSIFAVAAALYPKLKIYAFQLMNNHVHMVVDGDERMIKEFFSYFRNRLERYFDGVVDLSGFELKLFRINDLTYFRNAIAYVNRNGFVVNNDVTPFSYPWGTGVYYFQPVMKKYVYGLGTAIGVSRLRSLMHTRRCDGLKELKMVDDYVSPLEFCDIDSAENLFHDAKQYFYLISRNVEAYSEVAMTIGESIFYTDNDLYIIAAKLSKERYGTGDLKMLTPVGKIVIPVSGCHGNTVASDECMVADLRLRLASLLLKRANCRVVPSLLYARWKVCRESHANGGYDGGGM